jgi:hypothetical protein
VVAALVDFLLHHLQQFGRNRQCGLFGLGDQGGVVGEGAKAVMASVAAISDFMLFSPWVWSSGEDFRSADGPAPIEDFDAKAMSGCNGWRA